MRAFEYILTTLVSDPKGNVHVILMNDTERIFVPIFIDKQYASFLQRSMETDEEIDLASFWQFQTQSWGMMGFEPLSLIIDHTNEDGLCCFVSFNTRQEVSMRVVTSYPVDMNVAFILAWHFDFTLYLTDQARTCLAFLPTNELDKYLQDVTKGEGAYGDLT